jgi:7-cyano-7-deazaguanine synthase
VSTVVVLLSGGLDSTVCAAIAHARGQSLLGLRVDYGQRHRVELDHAAAVAEHYGAEVITVRLNAGEWGGSALTDTTTPLPQTGSVSSDSIPVTYVPARNIVFLAIAAGVAEARDAEAVLIGVNALDYSGYPDCRPEFVDAFRQVLAVGQRRGIEGRPVLVETPLIDSSKAEIVGQGIQLAAPLHLTWSCYAGAARPCGLCESCVLRARGFAEAGVPDPALGPVPLA